MVDHVDAAARFKDVLFDLQAAAAAGGPPVARREGALR
jgi:hypothetical protein